jgi:hypothetical protein
LYRGGELGGLPCQTFCEAVSAEGVSCSAGANKPLHLHELFHSADLFRQGKPTMISFGQRDVRQGVGTLPVTERIQEITFGIPWLKKYRPDLIAKYALCYRKVAQNVGQLIKS